VKILVILNDLDVGGAQNYTISLMNEFVKLGHIVELRVLSNIQWLKERVNKRINIKYWARKGKFDINVLLKVRNEVILGKYDYVIASYILFHKFATVLIKNIPLTIYPIHKTQEESKKSFFFDYLTFKLKRKNEIFLTSIESQTEYICNTFRLDRLFFKQIYNGINTEKFNLSPENFNRERFLNNLGIDPGNKILLMVAGFREEKRHIDAINAFILLKKELDNVFLVCLGDNRKKEREELQNYIESNNVRNIKLLLASESGDVREFYWSADVFTLTSNKVETFPISALEALSTGLPCVLTDVGGTKDFIINSFNGVLSKANNIIDIKDKWLYVLNNYEQFNKIDIRRNIEENYSIQKSAVEYLKLNEAFGKYAN